MHVEQVRVWAVSVGSEKTVVGIQDGWLHMLAQSITVIGCSAQIGKPKRENVEMWSDFAHALAREQVGAKSLLTRARHEKKR